MIKIVWECMKKHLQEGDWRLFSIQQKCEVFPPGVNTTPPSLCYVKNLSILHPTKFRVYVIILYSIKGCSSSDVYFWFYGNATGRSMHIISLFFPQRLVLAHVKDPYFAEYSHNVIKLVIIFFFGKDFSILLVHTGRVCTLESQNQRNVKGTYHRGFVGKLMYCRSHILLPVANIYWFPMCYWFLLLISRWLMFWYNKLIKLSTSAVSSTSDTKVGPNLKDVLNFYPFPKCIMVYYTMLKERTRVDTIGKFKSDYGKKIVSFTS